MQNTNKTLLWIIVLIVVFGIGYYIYSANYSTPSTQTGYSTNTVPASNAKGSVAVAFTDATASIKNINEVSMNVDKVELYSQNQGWVTVGSDTKVYKLLSLHAKGEAQLYAQADVSADSYTKARVTLGDIIVSTTKGDKTAVTPGKTMEIDENVVVSENKTTALKLDVLADKSLHITSKGDYVFAPVVKVEGRSDATVNTSASGTVTLNGGTVDTNTSVGMDVDGSVKNDFMLDTNSKLDVKSGSVINLNTNLNGLLNTNVNSNSGASSGSSASGSVNAGGSASGSPSGGASGSVNGALNGIINYQN